MKNRILSFLANNRLLVLFLASYFVIINLVVLNRFWQFEGYYFDHGIFDSAIWQVAHFQAPLIDHMDSRLIWQLGDHFTPTIFLLSPIYFFTSAYEPLLVVETLLITFSALEIYILAKSKIKSFFAVFSIITAYTFFIGLQNALIANFHSELIALATIPLAVIFAERKKWIWFWLMLILTLGTKENLVGTGVGLGIYLFFQKERKQGIAVAIFSLFYYFLTTRLVIPQFSHQPYGYETAIPSPSEMIINFFSPRAKLETIFVSLATFGFLPLLGVAFLPAIFQDLFVRFVLNLAPARWGLGLHYNVTLAVLLAMGAIWGARFLERRKLRVILFAFCFMSFIFTFVFQRFVYHGPLGLAFNPDFYRHSRDFEFLRKFLNKVPNAKLTMTQNDLAPYLSHRTQVMLLRKDYGNYAPDLIVFDLRAGQTPNAIWPLDDKAVKQMVGDLSTDKKYVRVAQSADQFYFKRVSY